jgi:hypothetical protein
MARPDLGWLWWESPDDLELTSACGRFMDGLIERAGLLLIGHRRSVIPLPDAGGVDHEAGVFAEQAFSADVQMAAASLHGNVVGADACGVPEICLVCELLR